MIWTELIQQFIPHLPHSEPPLVIDRVPKKKSRSMARTPDPGDLAGQMALATLGMDLPLQQDEPFFTRVRCDVTLPTLQTLTMTPKEGLFSSRPRWKINTSLPVSIPEQFIALLAEAARDGAPALRLLLTPLEDQTAGGTKHRLCVSTGVFQDQVGNLCAYSDWRPTGPEGRPLSSPQAAELLLQRMASVCLQAKDILLGQAVIR